MSDLPLDPNQNPPPASDPAAATPDPRDARIAELDQQVTDLQAKLDEARSSAVWQVTSTHPADQYAIGEPDEDARVKELIAQGQSEQDAIEQAAYEHRLWIDQNK